MQRCDASGKRDVERKVEGFLKVGVGDESLAESLGRLSAFCGRNTLRERWGLREALEERSLGRAEALLEALERVELGFDCAESAVGAMLGVRRAEEGGRCEEERLEWMALALERESREAARAEVCEYFERRSRCPPRGVEWFEDEFYGHLGGLEELEGALGELGVGDWRLAEDVRGYLEGMYEELGARVEEECGEQLGALEVQEVSARLVRGLGALRGELLAEKLVWIARLRERAVGGGFEAALRKGGPFGTPRPIDAREGEPERYLGDMGAWIHQVLVGERELFEGNFLMGSARIFELVKREVELLGVEVVAGYLEGRGMLTCLLNVAFRGVAVLFEERVERVLVKEGDDVLPRRLANVLRFYGDRFERLLGVPNVVSRLFRRCEERANGEFMRRIELRMRALQGKLVYPPLDFSAPKEFLSEVDFLRQITGAFESSMAADVAGGDSTSRILSMIVDPLVKRCEDGANEQLQKASRTLDPSHHRTSVIEHTFYVCRLLHIVADSLRSYCPPGLYQEIDRRINQLAAEHANSALERSGLSLKLDAARGAKPCELSSLPGMDPCSLFRTVRTFESHLLGIKALVAKQLAPRLTDPLLSKFYSRLASSTSQLACDAYSELRQAVLDPLSGYDRPECILQRTPAQLESLLT